MYIYARLCQLSFTERLSAVRHHRTNYRNVYFMSWYIFFELYILRLYIYDVTTRENTVFRSSSRSRESHKIYRRIYIHTRTFIHTHTHTSTHRVAPKIVSRAHHHRYIHRPIAPSSKQTFIFIRHTNRSYVVHYDTNRRADRILFRATIRMRM